MKLLVLSATKLEISPSLPILKKWRIPVVITGVGASQSVYSITRAFQQYQPQVAIQAGIGGCFDKNISLGKVVTVSQELFGDIGVLEQGKWRSVFDMGFAKPDQKPFKNGVLKNPYKKMLTRAGLDSVAGVTINEISTNKARISLLKARGAVVESMEGAALHYVALMEKIPFLQIRGISNYVGERDKRKWNIKDAIDNLNNELVRIVEQMAGDFGG
jgi:futalosine hydrolase